MYQIVEGRRYLYTPGSCCLMNRDTLHTEETSTDFICIFFSVSSNFIKMLTNYGNPMLFPQEQHRNTKDFIDFVPRISAKEQKILVHDIFEQMIFTLLYPYYGSTYHLQDLFFQLIDILCDEQYYQAIHVTAKKNMESL